MFVNHNLIQIFDDWVKAVYIFLFHNTKLLKKIEIYIADFEEFMKKEPAYDLKECKFENGHCDWD